MSSGNPALLDPSRPSRCLGGAGASWRPSRSWTASTDRRKRGQTYPGRGFVRFRRCTVRGRRYDLVAFGALFLCVAGYFSYAYGSSHVQQLRAHRTFIPIAAVVVSSQVVERGGSSTTRGTSYAPRIVTRYSVDQQTYESDRYFFAGKGWRDRESARSVVDRFQPGSATRVFVDPADPTRAILDATPPGNVGFIVVGSMLVFPLALIVHGLGIARRRPEHRAIQLSASRSRTPSR